MTNLVNNSHTAQVVFHFIGKVSLDNIDQGIRDLIRFWKSDDHITALDVPSF